MSDSDTPLNRCFGIYSRKTSKKKPISSRLRAESSTSADVFSNPPSTQQSENEKVNITCAWLVQHSN